MKNQCIIEGCDRPPVGRGLCKPCHARMTRQGKLQEFPLIPCMKKLKDQCSEVGCCANVLARGFCSTHYSRWRLEADPDRYGKCKELYCLRPKYAQGLCRKHYDQWRYFEGMIKPSTKTICDIFDCENRVCADGTCIPHNLEIRLQRKEDAIFRIFGMTLEDYSWLLYEEQKGICPPCLEIAPSLDEMLQNEFWPIDHDHACCPLRPTCGMCVRGIVCRTCNGALTKHWQDQEWRIRAIAYLGIRK